MPYAANVELMLLGVVVGVVVVAWSAMELFNAWAWLVGKIFG